MWTALRKQADKSIKKVLAALPVVVFFLSLFYTVLIFFDVRFVMIVSVTTVLFKTNYRKQLTLRKLASIILTQLALGFLAFFATLNLMLCILLNITVPFLLVFLQSSQFLPMAYFSGAMTFTMLQMRPVGWEGFPEQLAVQCCGLAFFVVGLLLYSKRHPSAVNYDQARKGIVLLAEATKRRLLDGEAAANIQDIFDIQQTLYKAAYQSRGVSYIVTGAGKMQYRFALLLQRAVFFLTGPGAEKQLTSEERHMVEELVDFMRRAAAAPFDDNAILSETAERLADTEGHCSDVYGFARNFLRLYLIILIQMPNMSEKKPQKDWKVEERQPLFKKILSQLHFDAFETRFALRLSVVMTIGFVCSMTLGYEHCYWFAMNAFLLLRPMVEDSNYRMKTRFLGTVAGCLIIHFLLPSGSGSLPHFVVATIMVVGLYSEVPGTWIHAVFVTCFAMSMATLMLPQPVAIELRIAYVAAAALLVLVVNRFFFPTSLTSQFNYNLELIFHMQHRYLRMVEKAIEDPVDYGEISDAQMQYHLVYDQLLDYLKAPKQPIDTTYYKQLLAIAWQMVSEAEQMLFLINHQRMTIIDERRLREYLKGNRYILDDLQEMLELPGEKTAKKSIVMDYHRDMEGAPELSRVMEQYAKELSALYRLVVSHS